MPRNAFHVRPAPGDRLSELSLRHEVVDDGPDWPVVSILVDGRRPFEAVAPGWRGFDPAEMLGAPAPLLPARDPRRVALYRCTCGIAGCGVIAATIERSPDGRRISWTDLEDHVGVFVGPLAGPGVRPGTGKPWPLADVHFDSAQYEAEVRRLAADSSWESPGRRTARRVQERLEERGLLAAAPELDLRWSAPASDAEGVLLSFDRRTDEDSRAEQVLLHLHGGDSDPDGAAEAIVEQLAEVDPRRWSQSFAYRARR